MTYDIVLAAICILLGYLIGRFQRLPKHHTSALIGVTQADYKTRQINKVLFHSDSERIKELNALSAIESNLYRLLKHEFPEFEVIIKGKRFFIVDADTYPIAIFEYHKGKSNFKVVSEEDGVPLYIYKSQFLAAQLKEDADQIKIKHKNTKL